MWRFLQHVTITDVGINTGTLDRSIRSHWLCAASKLRVAKPNADGQLESVVISFLGTIFGESLISPLHMFTTNNNSRRREVATIRVAVHLLLRAMSSQAIQHIIHRHFQAESRALSTSELRQRFVELTLDIHAFVTDELYEMAEDIDGMYPGNYDISIAALVDDVLSLVYGKTKFGCLRSEMSALLMNLNTPGSAIDAFNRCLGTFIAQMTGVKVANRFQQVLLEQNGARSGTMQSAWSRRWLLEPQSLRVCYSEPNATQGVLSSLSVIEFACFVREFGCFGTSAGESMAFLSLQSVLSIDLPIPPMQLLLNGELHELHVLPSGLSPVVVSFEGWTIREYTAIISDGGQSVDVELFSFEEGSGRVPGVFEETNNPGQAWTIRRLQMSLRLHLHTYNTNQVSLLVHGALSVARFSPPRQHQSFHLDFFGLPSAQRLATYDSLEWTSLMKAQAEYTVVSSAVLDE